MLRRRGSRAGAGAIRGPEGGGKRRLVRARERISYCFKTINRISVDAVQTTRHRRPQHPCRRCGCPGPALLPRATRAVPALGGRAAAARVKRPGRDAATGATENLVSCRVDVAEIPVNAPIRGARLAPAAARQGAHGWSIGALGWVSAWPQPVWRTIIRWTRGGSGPVCRARMRSPMAASAWVARVL